MAKKKKEKDLKEIGARREIKRLWKIKSVPEWLTLLQELAPELGWEMEGQSSIKGRCPYHDDANPSFHLNFHKSMGKCFGDTCEKVVVDLVNLVAKLRHSNYTEALMFLQNRWQLGDTLLSNSDELNKYNNVQELKKHVAMASNKVLIEVLRDNPNHLAYCRPALIYLLEARNLPMAVLHALPVGVFAKPEHLKKHMPDTLHALFDEYFKKYQSVAFWGALLFYYNDSPGSITRFKLRLRDNAATGNSPTIEDLRALNAVAKRQLYKKEFAYIEDPYTNQLGVFGLYKYQYMVGRSDANAYLTEGEFDALAVMAAQDMGNTSEFMIMSTGGKGGTSIGFLREFGVRTAWLIPDKPVKNGDDYALSVLGDKSNFSGDSIYRPLEIKIFQWPAHIMGDDLDEAVQKTGYAEMIDYLVRNRTGHFLDQYNWVINRCDNELLMVKRKYDSEINILDDSEDQMVVQRENLITEKLRTIQEVLIKWYRYLSDSSDKLRYTQRCTAQEGIDISKLEEIRQQANGLNTFNGVVDFVEKSLSEYFSVAYSHGQGSAKTITFWSKTTGAPVDLIFDDKKLQQHMAEYLGNTVTKWLDNLLGNNEVYLEGTEELSEMKASKVKLANAMHILHSALNQMCTKIVPRDNLDPKDQGIHFVDLPQQVRNANIMYLVNGNYVFKGRFTEPGQMEWERLNSMADRTNDIGVLFAGLKKGAQWSHITDVSDLNAANQVDLNDVYTKIRTILSGWKFQHHEITEQYMAAYIMSLPIMCAVGDVNITLITGEKESGKTSLVLGLLGGLTNSSSEQVQPILESAMALSDATAAAIYQNFDRSTLTFILDEAENNRDSKHDERNRDITKMCYGMPMGAVKLARGGATKDGRIQYLLRMPVIMAAINIPTDSTFLSRAMIISMVKESGRQNLPDYIAERFSPEEIAELRKSITVGLIPHIPQIIKIRNRLRKELPDLGKDIVQSSNRFINTILTPLSVYEFLGLNAHELYVEILKRNKNRLDSIHGQDSINNLINTCLYTEKIKVPTLDISTFVSARTLILKYDFDLLNSSECGVYFIDEKSWIVIVWRQVKYTIFRGTPYEHMEESSIKEQVAKNRFVLPEVSPDDHNTIQSFLYLSDVRSPADYSVVEAGYLIKTSLMQSNEGNEGSDAEVQPNWEMPSMEAVLAGGRFTF